VVVSTPRVRGRDAAAYLLSRLGCVHPFTLSRALLLAELRWFEARGERLTDLRYVAAPGTFYIEGFKEIIEGDECFSKREGDPSKGVEGCIEYRCEPPRLDEEVARLLDEVAEAAKKMDRMRLHNLVLSHPLYDRIVEKG